MGKIVIIFEVDNNSSVHIDSRNKINLVIGEGPTQGLDNSALTEEAKYSNNFIESGKRFVLSQHYNGSNRFSFVNAVKMYHFKGKDSKIKPNLLCLGYVSKDFKINNMKNTRLKWSVKFVSVDCKPIDTNNILDIHRF